MRVEVRARDESEITSLHGKYPLGWLEVGEEAVSAVVQARASLLNSIAMHLPLVSSGGFAISLTLPYLESYPIGFYPLLAYTYRANASASPE